MVRRRQRGAFGLQQIFGMPYLRKRRIADDALDARFGWVSGYVFAIVGCLAAVAVAAWHDSTYGSVLAFSLLVSAILACAVMSGLTAGLVATALATAVAALSVPVATVTDGLTLIASYCVIGGLISWFGQAFRDLRSDTRIAEQQAHQREEQLRLVLQTVPDAAVVIDDKGRIVSFNPAAERQFGYMEAEICGQNIKRLMPQPYHDHHDNYLLRYRETGEKRIIGKDRVVSAQRQDGSVFPILLSIGEVRVADTVYFTGFMHDLSHRAEVELRLEKLHGELARISRLNELGEMAATLAHELNQPLATIANYIHGCIRLLDTDASANSTIIRGALEQAALQSVRAGKIIHHLRASATHDVTEMRLEELRSVVEEAAALALAGCREKGIHATFSFLAHANKIYIDRVQIQQVLINLIRNAGEAMQDSPQRDLTIRTLDTDTGMVAVEIADTGPGISENMDEQLFIPLITSKPGGMGMGLAISKRIIEAHGGDIGVERNASDGATFRFTLPVVDDCNVSLAKDSR